MELIEGQSLAQILEEKGPMSAAEAAQVGIELCRALAAVHGAGLVHRDVKTANVLRERGGRIVLTDFGLGVLLGADQPRRGAGALAGSPLFMAPEQVSGGGLDPRTDLYALGVVLYNLSSGKFPVKTSNLDALLERIESGSLLPLRDARAEIPEDFAQAVMKACARDPAARFQSAGEMERALLVCRGAGRRRGPWTRRGTLWALASLAAALALAVPLWRAFQGAALTVEKAALWLKTPAGPKLLADGDTVETGSSVYLEFQAEEEAHVYVINEDARGERHLLFPRPEGELQNPLRGGRLHRLPGPVEVRDPGGALQYGEGSWTATSAGGKEWIFIRASLEPVEEIEGALAGERRKLAGSAASYLPLGEREMRGVLRGFGGLSVDHREKIAAQEAFLADFAAALREGEEGADREGGVWLRKLTLNNP
jgi:hypothetical protein